MKARDWLAALAAPPTSATLVAGAVWSLMLAVVFALRGWWALALVMALATGLCAVRAWRARGGRS